MNTKITILGCGSSSGVPVVGCNCKICISESPYNKRLRSSILIHSHTTNILVDFGCDTRIQMLSNKVNKLDAIILTHAHVDHMNGIDDLKVFVKFHKHKPLKLYTDKHSMDVLFKMYPFLFNADIFEPIEISFYDTIIINNIEISFFKQEHGLIDSLGFCVGCVVYTNDVISYPEDSKQYLSKGKIWIMDCVDYEARISHFGLNDVLKYREIFSPEKIYLTNMSHKIDFFEISKHVPSNIFPCYDGMVIDTE